MFYTKNSSIQKYCLEFTTKMKSHWLFATGGIQFMALLIHSFSIRKRPMIVAQLWLKFYDVKAVMWLFIKAHLIQIDRYTFSNIK